MKKNRKHYTIINIRRKNSNDYSLTIRTEKEEKQLGYNTNTPINNLALSEVENFMNNELYNLYKKLHIIDFKSGVIGVLPGSNNYYLLSSDVITSKFQKMVLLKYIVNRTIISKGINLVRTKTNNLKSLRYYVCRG